MTTKTKPETEEPPRRGYHAPDYDPVNVYGHRDIPSDFPPKWRTALSLLVSGPKPRRGYHAPDYDPVNVYGHRDIPLDFPPKWRTALSLLVSGPKRKDTISIMTGSPVGEPWGYHSKCTDSLMTTITDKVGNLCESDDGILALVSPDGQSFVGGRSETTRTIARRKAACYNSMMGARQ